MRRWVAFLRAINVGGHTVKMEALRRLFEEMGFEKVEPFIASGNVIFEAESEDGRELEMLIEGRLKEALGYAVATFLRSEGEVGAIAGCEPFEAGEMAEAAALNVAFLASPLEEAGKQKLMGLETEIDRFAAIGREIYWLCRKKQSESTFSNAVLEKTLRAKSTLRGVNTVRKIAEKLEAA